MAWLAVPFVILGCCYTSTAQVPGNSPDPRPPSEIQVEEDPTKPVIFSIRNEYRNLKNDAWANTVLLRIDRLTLKGLQNKGGGKGLILRFDLPINTVHRGVSTKTGLGDIYAQALYIPHVRPRFVLPVGTGIVLPTATNRLLGQGKLILAPIAVPTWYFAKRKRFFFVRMQYFVSVAGGRNRPNVNYLVADPTLAFQVSRGAWAIVNTELKWDWRSDKGSGISGVQFGKMISRKMGIWIKPEIPWGAGRQTDFAVKVGLVRFR